MSYLPSIEGLSIHLYHKADKIGQLFSKLEEFFKVKSKNITLFSLKNLCANEISGTETSLATGLSYSFPKLQNLRLELSNSIVLFQVLDKINFKALSKSPISELKLAARDHNFLS